MLDVSISIKVLQKCNTFIVGKIR